MYVLGLGSLIEKLFRNIFFLIDEVIYNSIPRLYNLLITIAKTSPLSQANIADMAGRIYKLLAVFMIFKVTFSLIMYIVNPDDFSDKTKGVSKLITNIIISLAVLVLTPFVFSYAYQFQSMILNSNALGTLIFGKDSANTSNAINTAGDQMAYIAMSTFFVPNLNYFNCTNMYNIDENGNIVLDDRCFGFTDVDQYIKDDNTCSSPALSEDRTDLTQFCKADLDKAAIQNYAAGVQYGSYSMLFRKDIATSYVNSNTEEFAIDYSFIMSTVVGVLILLFLITTSMDVALRSIKLAFLQLIAPIPILSYIDPKSGKDGMFKKWYQMAFKTYLSLFVRLLALYFAIYIISRMGKLVDIVDGHYITNRWIQIFIIIGALMFAKNFIKILEGLGLKLDGGFTLNPIKKFNEQVLGGKRITGAAGALTAATADRTARFFSSPGLKAKAGALFGVGGPGLVGSAVRGFAGNKGFGGGISSQANVNRKLREGRIKGLSPMASYLDYAGSVFGLDDATLERKSRIVNKNKEELRKADKAYEDATRENDIRISENKRKLSPAKALQSRRKNALAAAEKMQSMAEDVASKKANFADDADTKRKREMLARARTNPNSLTADEILELANNGVAAGDPTSFLKYERALNARSYTKNRRSDAANIEFMMQNQGQKLDRDIIVGGIVENGKLKGEKVFHAGETIDASMIASAQDAQGMYIKASKKQVFNALLDGKAQDVNGKTLDEYAQFQSDLAIYNEEIKLTNDATSDYNGTEGTEKVTELSTNIANYDAIDANVNNIKSSDDNRKLTQYVNTYETENERLAAANDKIKQGIKVTYYDENYKPREVSYDESKNRTDAMDKEVKHEVEVHQQRRSQIAQIGK